MTRNPTTNALGAVVAAAVCALIVVACIAGMVRLASWAFG